MPEIVMGEGGAVKPGPSSSNPFEQAQRDGRLIVEEMREGQLAQSELVVGRDFQGSIERVTCALVLPERDAIHAKSGPCGNLEWIELDAALCCGDRFGKTPECSEELTESKLIGGTARSERERVLQVCLCARPVPGPCNPQPPSRGNSLRHVRPQGHRRVGGFESARPQVLQVVGAVIGEIADTK